MTLQLETKRKISEAIEPAKKWRNKYWTPVARVYADFSVLPGFYWGRMIHPSRDVAESVGAAEVVRTGLLQVGGTYVGAFPFPIEGEAP